MARKKKTTGRNEGRADIGLIGLAVMGQNLILNMADHGYTVAVFNRTTSKVDDFIAYAKANEPSADRLIGAKSLKTFVKSIKRPRKIVLLVQAGFATDATIDSVVPHLDKGDIIIDGGNALWTDTIRREKELTAKGLEFIGSGVSGGETGARFGPSLMPGGSKKAWKQLEPIWKAIAAKVDRKTGKPIELNVPGKVVKRGEPCTVHIGANGAGHYVKMVHNGIEYIDMQLICEAYMLMKSLLGMKPDAMSEVFEEWNSGDLDSFLIEITADILQQRDPKYKRSFLVDKVLDTAGQKGTGKWTAANALDLGIPANAIAEAVFARCISAIKDERVTASKQLRGPKPPRLPMSKAKAIEAIRDALYCSKICAYAQGFQLMAEAQVEYDWKLDFGAIAKIFRGGCIIRARFLQKITEAYKADRKLQNLMLDPYFKKALHGGQANWRAVVSMATNAGVPIPAFASALSYYDGYRTAVLPANLLQAQRDYFGAHTFERTDSARGQFFHVDWPEPGRPMSKV
ncbi:NADP-dependent phosphogluconate dehydrogenase [Mucisphaera sp.]|uniref:NADP-dependent phosphogluconate dehydrogenase n=1 Tax=Mucisphaera sp. TaxID=2913024 RepID=UPI003D0CEAF3